MSKEMDSMFDALNDMAFTDPFSTPGKGLSQYQAGDDECEDVFTSREIVKMKHPPVSSDKTIIAPAGTPNDIEETCHFKTYTKIREHKYTESEMKAIRESCSAVIVHDYSSTDSYHISDEERYRNDSLRDMRVQLAKLHKMYNKVDQWIEAMRVVVKAWELLEQRDNFLHTSEEFYQMVAQDRIYHNGIIMPKLKGMGKYNIDVLIQYISNPEMDPKDLLTTQQKAGNRFATNYYDDFYDENESIETEDEKMKRLLTPEDAQYLIKHEEAPEKMEVHNVPRKMIKGYDGRKITTLSAKKAKKLPKKARRKRAVLDDLHGILNQIQSNPINRDKDRFGYTGLITHSMFEEDDEKRDFWKDLRFTGSWADKTDTRIYDLVVREALLQEPMPGSRYITYGDYELNQFFNLMEQAGLNVLDLRRKMNMTTDQQQADLSKRSDKETKKIEKAILQRVTKLNGDPKFKKIIAKAEREINEQANAN